MDTLIWLMSFFRDYLMDLVTVIIWFGSISGAIVALYTLISRIWKYYKESRPKVNIEFMRGGTSFVKQGGVWHIRNVGFKIRVPSGRPPLSIEEVEYSTWDLQSGEPLNQPSHECYLYLFPLRGPEKDWDLIRELQQDKTYPCCIPHISTGVFQNGEYKLILKIKCKAKAGRRSVERTLSRKFRVRDENAGWKDLIVP